MNPYLAGAGTLFLALVARLALEALPPQVVARPPAALRLGASLDLNRATAAELEALPGIGPHILTQVADQLTVGARPPPGSAPPRSGLETAPSPR